MNHHTLEENMKAKLFRIIATLVILLALSSVIAAQGPAHNLIIFVVDGMGPAQRQLGELAAKGGLSMNRMQHLGLMGTSSYGLDITDSAAAATAMFTGKKTYNNVIGYDNDLNQIDSIMDIAAEAGIACGIATNSELYDATAAAMYANVLSRIESKNISKQLVASGLALAIGAGSYYIDPLIQEAKLSSKAKPRFNHYYGLKALSDGELPAICLIGNEYLPMEIDDEGGAISLKDIVSAAIEKLAGTGKPFILLVESGSVDGASHDNDAAAVMKGVLAADLAVAKALDFARRDGSTLLLVVSDHDTGGMSLGANQGYRIGVSFLSRVRASAGKMAGLAAKDWPSLRAIVKRYTGYEMSEEEADVIRGASDTARAIGALVSRQANIAWGSGGHTASPVIVTAEGPGSEMFTGQFDNTDLFGKMLKALGLR